MDAVAFQEFSLPYQYVHCAARILRANAMGPTFLDACFKYDRRWPQKRPRTINQSKNFAFESGHTEKTNKSNILGLFGEGPLKKKKKASKKQTNKNNILGLYWEGPLEKTKHQKKEYFRNL